jgi:hypothetical protein
LRRRAFIAQYYLTTPVFGAFSELSHREANEGLTVVNAINAQRAQVAAERGQRQRRHHLRGAKHRQRLLLFVK